MTDTVNPRQNVTFDSSGVQAHGYLAIPKSRSGSGVILIQEWWGLDDHTVDADYHGLAAPVLGHFGAQDASIPASMLEQLREKIAEQSGIDADLRLYPAGHAFYNSTRPSYHHGSAEKAWTTTVEFLRTQVN
ncbi:dienelactone hydrolase family protein [Gordonia sp. CPCC 205333]|uniref:dienelactone hydrolase family protein n=1 Tax=Gordonia sp. CPCC 205333 TaxID=3140790 RepID=UPI003AF3B2E2